jgi:hypothetical protein
MRYDIYAKNYYLKCRKESFFKCASPSGSCSLVCIADNARGAACAALAQPLHAERAALTPKKQSNRNLSYQARLVINFTPGLSV